MNKSFTYREVFVEYDESIDSYLFAIGADTFKCHSSAEDAKNDIDYILEKWVNCVKN